MYILLCLTPWWDLQSMLDLVPLAAYSSRTVHICYSIVTVECIKYYGESIQTSLLSIQIDSTKMLFFLLKFVIIGGLYRRIRVAIPVSNLKEPWQPWSRRDYERAVLRARHDKFHDKSLSKLTPMFFYH